jgi:hypothetical protein
MTTLYETDFNLWIEQTVNQLKTGNIQGLDLENLIEEIDSMGRNNRREVRSRLIVLMAHLLKWQYQPRKRSKSWTDTINEQRLQLNLILEDSPSLKPFLGEVLDDCYQYGRKEAVKQTKLPLTTFPPEIPYSQEEVLSDFLPG